MFNTSALSAIVPFVLFLGYRFPFGRITEKQVPVIWTKRRAPLITFFSIITFENALLSQELSTTARRAIFIIPSQFPEGYRVLRLSTLIKKDSCDIIRTYCVYGPVVVIRGIEENRRREGDVIVIRPDSPLDHVLLSLTALKHTALWILASAVAGSHLYFRE